MLMLGCKGSLLGVKGLTYYRSIRELMVMYEEAIFKVTDETIYCCFVKRNIFDDLQIQDESYCQESISEVHRARETRMIKTFICGSQIFSLCFMHLLNELSNNWLPTPLKSPRN